MEKPRLFAQKTAKSGKKMRLEQMRDLGIEGGEELAQILDFWVHLDLI